MHMYVYELHLRHPLKAKSCRYSEQCVQEGQASHKCLVHGTPQEKWCHNNMWGIKLVPEA